MDEREVPVGELEDVSEHLMLRVVREGGGSEGGSGEGGERVVRVEGGGGGGEGGEGWR